MKFLPFEYAVRNLSRRPLRSALGIAGSVLVVLLIIASGAFVRGMQKSLVVTGTPGNVILLGTGSEESIERSQVDPRISTITEASVAAIRSRLGVSFISPEVHLALSIRANKTDEAGQLTVVRGVTERAFLVHPQVSIAKGRAPIPGQDEIAIGSLVALQLGLARGDLDIGSELWLDDRAWQVVGHLDAPKTVMDGEIWMPLSDLQIISRRDTLSCVVLTLEDPAAFGDVDLFATRRLDLEVSAMRESDYYRKMAAFMAPIRMLVIATALLIALGGLLGGVNTMYAAFATRARELAALQVLGYHRLPIVLSLFQECLLLNAIGAIIGTGLGMVLIDGIAIRMSMGAFGLIVDGQVTMLGLGTGLVLGLVGSLPPAWRCLRLPIPQALRSG